MVYGDMLRHNEQFFIKVIFNEPYEYEQDNFEVIPKTVGQYTGLKEIYEGDICQDGEPGVVEILWSDHHQWGCKVYNGGCLATGLTFPLWHWDKCEMNGFRQLEAIGNIFENPELLEQKP